MITTIQLLAPTGEALTTRKRLLTKYTTVGFGNLQALLDNAEFTRYEENNKYYFVQTEVEPVVEAWIAQRNHKKKKNA